MGVSVNRTMLAALTVVALLSLAAGEGSAPWRHTRVYGWEIMTKEERIEFRAEMRTYDTYDEQLAFWRRHVALMTERVWNRGLLLERPPEILSAEAKAMRQVIFANYLMTGAEIEAYRAKERTIRSKEEYEAFLLEHEIAMKAMAREKGLPIGPTPAERKREKKKREAAKNAK